MLETEASVVIAISSPHRLEAIEAVQYTIDTLKSKVPIWKKVWKYIYAYHFMLAIATIFLHVLNYTTDLIQTDYD